jgi:hypothetical protein
VDLSEEILTGILAPRAAEPEILDLVNLAEPDFHRASPVRPRTRRAGKKAASRKGELFEMPGQKASCHLCPETTEYGGETWVTRPLF